MNDTEMDMLKAMKEGVAIRLADLQNRIEELESAIAEIHSIAIWDEEHGIVSVCEKALKGGG